MSDRVPYGWKADPGSPIGAKGHHLGIVEDPDEQANIVRILELHGQNVGLRSICRRLDEAGIACRGHKWRHTTVRRIIMRVTTK